MKATIRKIIDMLIYCPDFSQANKEKLIEVAGKEGFFLGQEEVPLIKKESRKKSQLQTFGTDTMGIRARTWDSKVFYFFTLNQSDIENAMILMGYGSHGYWLSEFNDMEKPATPYEISEHKMEALDEEV